ncbi:hypothetical protein BFW38_10105 [Terasakiispira papahanaumokuakeensis]|uniref:Uncharacterized protein n=1 Tax=Terasakiispira papahanaumokuakeensis TaxID=197479 RepID=A0A1E2VA42_9GAMM|nr:hypothetical protein [Terasakiispira papahanaumokuakeensis]ODC03844.1 hypothetical protein BFW38_10105 [Terasakiispira papahanaumokuakeensis]
MDNDSSQADDRLRRISQQKASSVCSEMSFSTALLSTEGHGLSFESLPLHDAILKRIFFDWPKAEVKISLSAFITKGQRAIPCVLSFESVTALECPRCNEWGLSNSILDTELTGNEFSIQMQSGDLIKVKAASYVFGPVC